MKPFLHDDFLLETKTAQRLYHEIAKEQPIIDYHCHLPPEDVAANRQFKNLFEIWLEGDHYKWRAMRSNGIGEEFCTGDADPYDKFLAFAKTVPHTLRNPLYHWSHIELQRYFGIDTILNEETAPAIWDEANEKLQSNELSAHGILKKFKVEVVCTTDDPADSLEHHKAISEDARLDTKVYPTFRPDKALNIADSEGFVKWTQKLSNVAETPVENLASFKAAIKLRHDFFDSIGGRLSDHGLETCFADACSESEAASIFDKAIAGESVTAEEHSKFASHLMIFFGELDAEKNWTKQLHLGAMRNNNAYLFAKVGADVGCDSIGDFSQGRALSNYLSVLAEKESLPKTILYNLNPSDNYLMGTMIGNFQDGKTAGKIQFGSGWWFNDQKEAMIWQMNALSNLGLLSRFVGMLTDSRSFMSYPRHEYFRRILCNLIGNDVENGEIPNDWGLLSDYVSRICYGNAKSYFGF